MNAKKCDRCGAFYTEVEENTLMRVINDMGEALKKMTVGDPFSLFERLKDHVDLCKDCEKSLKKWTQGEAEQDAKL